MKQLARATVIEVERLPETSDECAQELYAVQSMFTTRCFCRFLQAQWVTSSDMLGNESPHIMVWHHQLCPFARAS